MTTIAFDTYKAVKALKNAGFEVKPWLPQSATLWAKM